ncbi:hypothetical protein YpEc11_11 [Yersinia phage vB_YpEc11]|uniref:Uncharacterized protein n=1 Tax=Yersinia phage vB_YpEc11 TaxID=3056113 RepID=A0AA51VH97_9CAUD|nr:hypothetical protein YpEc11_11 [Yersinia phage vB_YpEc11]
MRIAQGGYRKKPDGYLHLNNYSHTKASGIAGVLFERIFTERQQEIVEKTLIELANPKVLSGEANSDEHVIYKHDCYRFRKAFLRANFKQVVYGTVRLLKKSAAQMMSMAVVADELDTPTMRVRFPD